MHRFQGVQASRLQLPGAEQTAGRAGGTPVPAFRSLCSADEVIVFAAGKPWNVDVTVDGGSLAIRDSSTQATVLQCQLVPDAVSKHNTLPNLHSATILMKHDARFPWVTTSHVSAIH
jgi:hypothetical protein